MTMKEKKGKAIWCPRRIWTAVAIRSGSCGKLATDCRSIVEAHGERLWATADEDGGATFQFTLPTGVERIATVE
jgi:signal transduction histidine kinase